MWVRCLGFALLVCIPLVLHAQSAGQPCSAPSLNGGYYLPQQESYPLETKISYTCDDGLKPAVKGWWATSTCQNGIWSPNPQCIENTNECSEPPRINHAIVINQDYQEAFPSDSEVLYQCKNGYATEEGATKKSAFCRAGRWTEVPTCRISSSSGSHDSDTAASITTIDRCGAFPVVKDGDFIPDGQRSLKFECAVHYKLVGPETVVCYSNRQWSELPTCRADYCSVNTEEYTDLENIGVKYITNGYKEKLDCVDKFYFRNYALVECNDGIPKISRCCNNFQINTGICWNHGEMTN
ncbi:coagulation factor XIII B chain-like [Melanotaenia boesemani]|uniref:coagulation factor XIII B chain-like n=1 Tax=Melanotaenia boesemani TaxID=1250792 RepID=UPI001C058007|nr:coagulation factor XIII B chain-like [Melanotaenia boesemani]